MQNLLILNPNAGVLTDITVKNQQLSYVDLGILGFLRTQKTGKHIGYRYLARRTGCSEHKVRDALNNLKIHGYIFIFLTKPSIGEKLAPLTVITPNTSTVSEVARQVTKDYQINIIECLSHNLYGSGEVLDPQEGLNTWGNKTSEQEAIIESKESILVSTSSSLIPKTKTSLHPTCKDSKADTSTILSA